MSAAGRRLRVDAASAARLPRRPRAPISTRCSRAMLNAAPDARCSRQSGGEPARSRAIRRSPHARGRTSCTPRPAMDADAAARRIRSALRGRRQGGGVGLRRLLQRARRRSTIRACASRPTLAALGARARSARHRARGPLGRPSRSHARARRGRRGTAAGHARRADGVSTEEHVEPAAGALLRGAGTRSAVELLPAWWPRSARPSSPSNRESFQLD